MSLVPTLAAALRKLKAEELVAVLAELTKDHEIEVNINLAPTFEVPIGFKLVPIKMTPRMIATAKDHQWSDFNASRKIQVMWEKILWELDP